LAAFQRIQEYLLEPPRFDERLSVKGSNLSPSAAEVFPAIQVENVTIRPNPSTPPLLKNINFVVEKGSFVICAGPVGSGKTMLARALLGELPTASGTVSVASRRIACCEQSPWLPSGTLREAVCGFGRGDLRWYNEVIRLCCLDEDLRALPDGDQTMVGSRGLNLSGGQRQRVVGCLSMPLQTYGFKFAVQFTDRDIGSRPRGLCSLSAGPLGRLLQRSRRQD
jgi:ATP-binding cassette, subfamily C (CFTR/MRP), member 1